MNYYEAREIQGVGGKPSGLYRFTCMSDGKIWAVGRCAGDCPGHPTKEEACEHYRQGLIHDSEWKLETMHDKQERCEVCGSWTQEVMRSAHYRFVLCQRHQGMGFIESVMPKVGSIVSSY